METELVKGRTEADLEGIVSELNSLLKELVREAMAALQADNGNTHTLDLFNAAIVDRSIALVQGFLQLTSDNNYLAAVPFIRMQLDNCLRFYAATQAPDPNKFFQLFTKGVHISKMHNHKGKLMTDHYLVKQLNKHLLSGLETLYKNTSGHIHFSKHHLFANQKLLSSTDRTIEIRVGNIDCYNLDRKVDFAYNMLVVTKLVLVLVRTWKDKKEEIK